MAEKRERLLVVAGETIVGHELPEEIVERTRGKDAEVRAVFPALNTRLRHRVSDTDPAQKEAEDRLERSLSTGRREKEGDAEAPAGGDETWHLRSRSSI